MNYELENLKLTKGRITLLKNNNINSIIDLLNYIPRKYYDFRNPKLIKELYIGETTAIIGTVIDIKLWKNGSVNITLKDNNNWKIKITWFNQAYLINYLKLNQRYIICGKVIENEYNNKKFKSISPLYFSNDILSLKKIVPIYKKIKGIGTETFEMYIKDALEYFEKIDNNDFLEKDYQIKKQFNLCTLSAAYRKLHFPQNDCDIEIGKNRLTFNTLFEYSIKLNYENTLFKQQTNKTIPCIQKFKTCKPFTSSIPFNLTEDQKIAIKKLYNYMYTGKPINALLQGDVGTGKTIVAIFLALACAENNYQCSIMAPTDILAQQHYQEIKERLSIFPNIEIAFLSGNTKKKEKDRILKGLKNNTIQIIIGTHALISEGVEFNNLLLTIVDEQHRFGVEQREKLKAIHNINMSATPIPRTLGMAVYGNMIDIINIKTKPACRKPIITKFIQEEKEIYKFMLKEIKNGRQCYVICPLVNESECEQLANVDNVHETYNNLNEYFNKYGYNVSLIYGGKTKKEKDLNEQELKKFVNNESQILVATTIVEVGVNVPNATVITIKNAERFGLAQLHQLRGRVGRGSYQSYCLLQSPKNFDKKINIMCSTTDGFKIAEEDMNLRGTGDILGEKQSGYNKYIDNIITNPHLYDNINKLVISKFKDKSIYNYLDLIK